MEKFINEHLNEMIDDLRKVVAIDSKETTDVMPFGSNNRKVLDIALDLMNKKGMKTENLDYYCGYGEVGEGDKTIGILAHLDIVPAGDGWDSDPFTLTEKDGVLYGRGVSDDKGAAIASMWAIKYLLDTGYKFKKKVRLILGCNEETGSRCIKHYVQECGHVDMGFTPDGNFPGIYAEKGMIGGLLVGQNTKILDIKAGDATNIVAKKCVTKLPDNSFDKELLDKYFNNHNVKYELMDNQLTVYGKAAHASTPDEGVNAISHTFMALNYAGFKDSFVEFFVKNFGLTTHGELLGYEALKDSESNTSINFGLAYKEDSCIYVSLDMRFPVKQHIEACQKPLMDMADDNNSFVLSSAIEPLYFDINSPFIKALDKAYRDVSHDYDTKMEAIGGGTYAKAINNIIAFGCEFQNESNHIHDANECLSIESFKKQILIYIEAIKNLNEVA